MRRVSGLKLDPKHVLREVLGLALVERHLISPIQKNLEVVNNTIALCGRSASSFLLLQQEGYRFVDHQTMLGSRDPIAGVEYSLEGMKPGGYRKVRVSPHLAYRDDGIPGLIPPKAVLIIELWRRE